MARKYLCDDCVFIVHKLELSCVGTDPLSVVESALEKRFVFIIDFIREEVCAID